MGMLDWTCRTADIGQPVRQLTSQINRAVERWGVSYSLFPLIRPSAPTAPFAHPAAVLGRYT